LSDVPDIRLRGLVKRYGDQIAVDGVDLDVHRGEFFTLLGPSGSGKTTTLRMIAGFERPDAGTVELAGEEVSGRPPFERDVNTVFQDYALFPHLSVADNIAYGLRVKKVPKPERRTRVQEALEMVRLPGLGGRKPSQLSGGQRQRVALARAIVNRPRVLLLDEPLGALDLKLRRQMQIELKRIQTEVGITFIHVTHDQEEAMTMADTVAVMNQGVIEQLGDPVDLYDNPATTFVSNFLGQSNLVEAQVVDGAAGGLGDVVVVDVHGAKVAAPVERARRRQGRVWVGVRPEKVFLAEAGTEGEGGDNTLPGGVVTDVSFIGVSTQYLVRLPWGQELTVFEQNTGAREVFRPGTRVDLHWQPSHTFLLDADQDAHAGDETFAALGGQGAAS
jgi:spermidine/putrescine transport system ATP-binding protein